jgi:hypothetical protein
MSADPYKASAGPKDPKNWNRYSYVLGEPISFLDPRGTTASDANGGNCYGSAGVFDTEDSGVPLIGDITVTGQGSAYALLIRSARATLSGSERQRRRERYEQRRGAVGVLWRHHVILKTCCSRFY